MDDADPAELIAVTRRAVAGAPDRMAEIGRRHAAVLLWHEGTPATSADELLDDIDAIGRTFAVEVGSLAIALGLDRVVGKDFSAVHGGEGATVGEVCAVVQRSSVAAVRQAVARIQECITVEQVTGVLAGLRDHLGDQVAVVDALCDTAHRA